MGVQTGGKLSRDFPKSNAKREPIFNQKFKYPLGVSAAMALGTIATIGGIELAAAFARNRFMGLLARTESWRHRVGTVLEVGGSVMVLVFGVWMVVGSLPA
jgi:ABC-type nickel/cobalt efflux system permease component RcnA